MRYLNLFYLADGIPPEIFPIYEAQLSHRNKEINLKHEEINGILKLATGLFGASSRVEDALYCCDYFYYSFSIPKISKEFDLLRINDTTVINIEIKSVYTPKIQSQLIQNKYYLKSLQREVKLFCFQSDEAKLYSLSDADELITSDIQILFQALSNQRNCFEGSVENLFSPSDYLISPMNTPERFFQGEYFLTSQQDKIKRNIIKECKESERQYFGITGGPGTGKTLLLYDLALQLSNAGKCCIIHCGKVPEGLVKLNALLKNIDIIAVKSITDTFSFQGYDYILVDEAHRIYVSQFYKILQDSDANKLKTIFSFDEHQILAKSEKRADIANKIRDIDNIQISELSNKIRTNKELASFIDRFRNLHSPNRVMNYDSVSMVYATDIGMANLLLTSFKEKGYTFINYTSSSYNRSPYDQFVSASNGNNTHTVIGQEFENVVMLIDGTFYYDENGRLRAVEHPNPNYLYTQLLFQGLSRVREKLALIILDNEDVFKKALTIFEPSK